MKKPIMPEEIIDCHIHPYTTDKANLEWFFEGVTPEEFVAQLKKSGITKACGSVISRLKLGTFDWPVYNDFSGVHELNLEAFEFRDRFPDFYVPGLMVHPNFAEESCAEIEYYRKNESLVWIGELAGPVRGSSFSSTGALQIFDLASNLQIPVNVHPGNLDEIEIVCKRLPDLKLIMAHPTADKKEMEARIALCAKYKNLHLDISGSGHFRWKMLRYAIDTAGKEKFLFGTDFPICNPASFVYSVLAEPLSDEERGAIFSGNFKKLTGLK